MVEEWTGWGLVGARLCVPASDSSPQERHRHKRKLTVMVTKPEMTLDSHKTSQLEFSSKQTRELTSVTYTIATVKIVKKPIWQYKAISGPFYTAGDLRHPWGLLGSSLRLSSDSIIQLGEVVARLEGDDGWNTCGGYARCGAHESWKPDQPALFPLTLARILSRRNRRDSVVKPLVRLRVGLAISLRVSSPQSITLSGWTPPMAV